MMVLKSNCFIIFWWPLHLNLVLTQGIKLFRVNKQTHSRYTRKERATAVVLVYDHQTRGRVLSNTLCITAKK
ncbi:hypothetical protein BDB00DRAFT_845897 [Zychaea mexicana]|uniref:uncharacterized protein n=1 Tax=Zychaea mexicana TaxID=64656 RepID=UPI0022FDC989|nr:uncharacterized protein BDB00DRAFT_845897 [Zychaea mexicana]KAI9488951.1 hypothetical protein BDB00DRAFT_845897 [Zychaea mexicana]